MTPATVPAPASVTDTAVRDGAAKARHEFVPLNKLRPSPTNTREDLGDLAELVESIKQYGILQPLLARPKGAGFELVFGHRRLAAAKKAGLDVVPVIVRELTEQQVLEAQVVENCQRADIHPLDEADAYKRLHEEFKLTVDDIAAKVGRSKPHVYGRMKLCSLHPTARKEFVAGRFLPGVALMLARIPSPELQEKATKEILRNRDKDAGPVGTRDAGEIIRRNFMLKLDTACFDVKDGQLVPKAGSCLACPKRTGNEKLLFEDIVEKDLCTDPECFKEKQDADYARRVSAAKETGHQVATTKQSKELFPYGEHVTHGHVDLDAECYSDDKRRTWREIVGKELEPSKVTIARDGAGKVHEVVTDRDARKAAAENGAKWAKESRSGSSSGASSGLGTRDRAQSEQNKKAAEVRGAVAAALVRSIVTAAEKKGPTKELLRLWIHRELGLFNCDAGELAKARGIDPGKDAVKAIEKAADGMTLNELCGLLIELILADDVQTASSIYGGNKYGDELTAAAAAYKVDVKATTARVVKERAAAAKVAPAKPADAKPAKAGSKK